MRRGSFRCMAHDAFQIAGTRCQEAAHSLIDWKYALGLDLTDLEFDAPNAR